MGKRRTSRRERIRKIQTEAILQAAEEVFAAKGYHNAKMEDIAARAEFAAGSLYNYFKCKEDIFTAIFVRKMDMLYDRILAALEAQEAYLAMLQRLFAVYVNFMDENRDFFRLFVSFQAGPHLAGPGPAGKAWQERYERFRSLIEGLFAIGIEEGLFREFEPRIVAETVMAATNAAMVHWLRNDPQTRFSRRFPELLDLLFFGVARFGPREVPLESWALHAERPEASSRVSESHRMMQRVLRAAKQQRRPSEETTEEEP